MSGSPVLADVTRGSAARAIDHDNGYDDAASPIRPLELKPKVAPRGKTTGSFAAPIRDSFFDLAQRYQSLRDAARSATRAKKKDAAPLMNTAIRERRLTDLPPAPEEESTEERELPEEPTLVQPLALRPPEPVPPASEKRPTTVRPPPPPEPLPRMVMPSTMPPPVALPSSVPPPPAPPPSVWRPMLAAAALSATIGALVAGGFMALRGLSSSRPVATTESITAPPIATHDAASAGPCPVGAGTTAGTPVTSGATLTSTTGTYTSSGSTSRGSSSSSSASSSNGAVPLLVSVDNLPLESANGKVIEPRSSVLPANAFAHVPPVTISRPDKPAPAPVAQVAPAPKAVAVATPKQTAAERRRAKREAAAAAAHESQKASDDDDDDDSEKAAAAPPPPPAPTKGPDRAAIAKAVGRATAAATSCDSGPRQGRALITFAPSGNVQSVALVESFGDNAVNGCVLRALGRAHVAPFAGGPIEVRKGISW
ncbi:MAG TPA: hypothetical protein VFV94_10350 [Polyangiaceae bacterium]|nr:hypothetical protein [Polyangiaceae bacterium]